MYDEEEKEDKIVIDQLVQEYLNGYAQGREDLLKELRALLGV